MRPARLREPGPRLYDNRPAMIRVIDPIGGFR
jgi:hypothetical protein